MAVQRSALQISVPAIGFRRWVPRIRAGVGRMGLRVSSWVGLWSGCWLVCWMGLWVSLGWPVALGASVVDSAVVDSTVVDSTVAEATDTTEVPGCYPLDAGFWPTLRALPPGVIEAEADSLQAQREVDLQVWGDVRLFADGLRVVTPRAEYFVPEGRLDFTGLTEVFDGEFKVQAGAGQYWLQQERGEFTEVTYWIRSRLARGSAARFEQSGPGQFQLRDASFTTCPENRESWVLSAQRLRLDQERGRGHAYHVGLRFKNVPLFYFPYVNFPIDDRRQSGLLTPSVGYSTVGGFDLALPWYWNIAPNYDATLTPRWQVRRGLLLGSEWRYLQPWFSGVVDLDVLPDDALTGTDRHLIRWRQEARLAPNLALKIDATDLSDAEYLRDFGNNLFTTSASVVERRGELVFTQPQWRLTGRVQGFQVLDPTLSPAGRPYQRLPQLLFDGAQTLDSGLFTNLRAEWVQFQRSDSVEGSRFDFLPTLGYRVDQGGFFFEPKVSWRLTDYRLTGREAAGERRLQRNVPSVSADAGLIFERGLASGNLQTLEPRFFYGYVPYRDQDAFPLFDTVDREFSFDSLFSTRRFSGSDRVGDTHQVTTALTSRVLDPGSGHEMVSVSAGQIAYLTDRRVRLRPDQPDLSDSRSDLALELQWAMRPGWRARGSVIFDTERERSRLTSGLLSYRPQERAWLNLGYRQREGVLEQTDVSMIWPLTSRVQGITRWNYSLRDDRSLETLAALEYRSCCYAVQFAWRRFLKDAEGSYNNAVYVQLTLNGLTRLDSGLDNLLREGIAGYDTLDSR